MPTRPDDPAFSDRENLADEVRGPRFHVIGLTKREYFAGLAMQGIMSAVTMIHSGALLKEDVWVTEAVKCADRLILELNK